MKKTNMDFIEENIPTNPVRVIVTAVLLPPILLLPLGKICTAILAILLLFLVTSNRPYWIYILSKTCKRDSRIIFYMMKCVFNLWWYERNRMTVAKAFNLLVDKHPDKVVFHTDEGPWTYKKLSEYSNQASHMFKEFGIKRGESVGVILFGGGGARYPGLWLALSYLGAPVALIPPQLRSTALIHSIKAAKASVVVYSHHLVDAIQEIRDDPDIRNIKLLQYNIESDTPILNNATCMSSIMKRMPTTTPYEDMSIGGYRDVFMYIYTSGTTGLPKAAVITNMRYLMVTLALNVVSGMSKDDIMYTPLPLHHTAGGMLGAGQALVRGTTVVLRGKFSASNFWKDCIKYNCTVAQYIGEICRFLLVAAEKSGEADPAGPHRLRLMVGNGLKPSIWEKFQKTFKIPDIYELYGATEGNTNMINITSKVAAIGFVPRFAYLISPIYLVKCDGTTGELIRDDKGFCIPCKPCEPGLMLGKLNHNNRLYAFTGYADKESTNKKILRNIFASGDCFFNSGDILVMDHYGYYYFMDRTGDTFRWRGENVSTTEVENILTKIIALADNSVYGVQIPNVEGRAGMAAIVDPENKIDFQNLVGSLKKNLPAYAHPVFIRILPTMPVTTTFKMIKKDLQVEGFDINKVKDKIYFLDPSTATYVTLTPKIYDDIVNGRIRL